MRGWVGLHNFWWGIARRSYGLNGFEQIVAGLLALLSFFYSGIVALRNRCFDLGWLKKTSLPCRVISIGNISVCGTGKTPCVEWVARRLVADGYRVAVLSRGYGSRACGYWVCWKNGRLEIGGSAREHKDLADEPLMLAKRLEGIPVVVDRNRAAAGRMACDQFKVDAVILDDGFQHRQLDRHCDVVLLSSQQLAENRALLPRGPLRESLQALRRAQVTVLNKADEYPEAAQALAEQLRDRFPHLGIVKAQHEPQGLWLVDQNRMLDLDSLRGKRVGLVSSIGDPIGFETTVRNLRASVRWHLAFPDHHAFRGKDREAIRKHCKEQAVDAVITTEKDWVRLERCLDKNDIQEWYLQVLSIRMNLIEGEKQLYDRLAGLFNS